MYGNAFMASLLRTHIKTLLAGEECLRSSSIAGLRPLYECACQECRHQSGSEICILWSHSVEELQSSISFAFCVHCVHNQGGSSSSSSSILLI